jgi:hypothetical protein
LRYFFLPPSLFFSLTMATASIYATNAPRVFEPERIAPWCDTVKLTFFAASGQLDESVVPREQISCAFGFPRNAAGAIELGKHKTRGWDVLGGHVDEGEQSVVAVAREIKKEAGCDIAVGDLELFAYERLVETGPRRSLKHPAHMSHVPRTRLWRQCPGGAARRAECY